MWGTRILWRWQGTHFLTYLLFDTIYMRLEVSLPAFNVAVVVFAIWQGRYIKFIRRANRLSSCSKLFWILIGFIWILRTLYDKIIYSSSCCGTARILHIFMIPAGNKSTMVKIIQGHRSSPGWPRSPTHLWYQSARSHLAVIPSFRQHWCLVIMTTILFKIGISLIVPPWHNNYYKKIIVWK